MTLNETYIEIKIGNIFSNPLHCWDRPGKGKRRHITFVFQRCFQQFICKIQLNRKDWNWMGYIYKLVIYADYDNLLDENKCYRKGVSSLVASKV